ncbi:MAG: hypothetical protein ABIQ30_02520 [Devosia sp.]
MSNLTGTSSTNISVSVQLNVDGVNYTASKVWELSARWGPSVLAMPTNVILETKGEAFEFTRPDGRTMFVLRRGHIGTPSPAFASEFLGCVPGKTATDSAKALATFHGQCDLDRLTFKIVTANEAGDLIEIPYDPKSRSPQRVSILGVTASTTEQPLSEGIVARHPWIKKLPHGRNGGARRTIYYEDFSRT